LKNINAATDDYQEETIAVQLHLSNKKQSIQQTINNSHYDRTDKTGIRNGTGG
jgi:hypothetical protein